MRRLLKREDEDNLGRLEKMEEEEAADVHDDSEGAHRVQEISPTFIDGKVGQKGPSHSNNPSAAVHPSRGGPRQLT